MRMPKFMLCLAPLLFLANPTPAGAPADTAPALLVQVRSLDRVFEQTKLILSLIGREELGPKIDGLLRAKIGPGGIEGVDHKKPLGVVVSFGKDIGDIAPLFLVPISDEKAFLKMLETNRVKFEKGKNDRYTINLGRDVVAIEVHFRFTKGYLAATILNAEAIEDATLGAALKHLGNDGPTFSAALRLDKVPLAARQLALAEFEKFYAPLLKEKGDGPLKSAQEFQVATLESMGGLVKSILTEGRELKFSLDLEPKSKKVFANLSLTAQSGSELEKTLASLEKQESRFGSLVSDKIMFNAVINMALPEKVHKAFGAFFDEIKTLALADLTDKAKRLEAEALLTLMEPTFQQGKVDAFFVMDVTKENTLDYFVAVGLKDGKKLEAKLRTLVEEARKAMPEKERDRIKLDFAKEGGLSVHRIQIPDSPEFAALSLMLGDSSAYFIFRDDAMFVSLGKGGLDRIKQAATGAKSAKAPLLLYRADVHQLAGLMAGKGGPGGLDKLFPPGSDSTVLMRIEGGRALTVRIELPLNVFLMSRIVERK